MGWLNGALAHYGRASTAVNAGTGADPRGSPAAALGSVASGLGSASGDRPYPWIGKIANTWSAALRSKPAKAADDPYRDILADLPRDAYVTVVGREGGWYQVAVNIDGEELAGYVSRELVEFVGQSTFEFEPLEITVDLPSVGEALVVLRRAGNKMAAQTSYKPTEEEESPIFRASAAFRRAKKYVVDDATFAVDFAASPGKKLLIDTIEDFIVFVTSVERRFPSAKPSEVASEIRQLWFSDENWELLVASGGIVAGGKRVDIETEPDPTAARFDMKHLAPSDAKKTFATRLGRVNIAHVLAGIDATLSGFPSTLPGSDTGDRKLKFETLKTACGGDPRDFVTWSGDLGQAYAEFLVARFVASDSAATLAAVSAAKMTGEELLGDIHGYIAAEVRKSVPEPLGPEVSSRLIELYLVDKSARGETCRKYVELAAGKTGAGLEAFATDRVVRFARPWFAKKAFDHQGWWESKGWSASQVLNNGLDEFDRLHAQNESTADAKDRLDVLVNSFMKLLDTPLK